MSIVAPSRSQVTALVAVGIHVALFWGATSRPSDHRAAVVAKAVDTEEVSVEVVADRPLEVASTSATETVAGSVAQTTSAARARSPSTETPSPASSITPSPEAPVLAAPSPEPSGSPIAMFDTAPKAIGLSGTGALNPFFARGASSEQPPSSSGGSSMQARPVEPKTMAESKQAVERSMKESIATRIAKGLGPEGPVLRALQDATYGGFAPVTGTATFLAVVDADGLVTALRLLRSRPGGHDADSGWDDAREHAAAALIGKRLAMRGSRGAELHIEVESGLRLPSGSTAGGSSVTANTTQSFDVADIGGKGRRVVRARLVGVSEM